ncbi:hypothetical protein F5883DRAFT_653602 [Diaporthe sp. PMI_573]|nr:hypothetical protein F5883DRAFT_653602 [Diaporthaceae sp. PMI_573]
MASTQNSSRRVLARVIAAYSDVELDQYLKKCRLQGGGATVVDVEDPENLPESFIQRLRDRAQHTSDATQSRPIDLDQVTARLLATTGNNPSPRPPFDPPEHLRHLFAPPGRSGSPTPPPIPREETERVRYNELVLAGGRPLYPIDLIDDVVKDPFAHWDMLRPWVAYPPSFDPDPITDPDVDRSVFGNQMCHWRDFRRWQAHNRREGRPRYVGVDSYFVAADRAYNDFVWYFRRGSPNYTEAAKKLLAQYDFTRPFQLQDDPKQQDKLTTWIEYLGYACAVHCRYTRVVEKLQPDYDTAWKALVDSKVLKPSETEEYICDLESAFQHQSEEDQAQKAVKSAEAALVAVQKASRDPRGSRLTPSARLATAQTRLDAAKESLKSIKRRNDLTTDFSRAARNYLIVKEDADRHRAKLRWILEQVPLIEAELKESKAAVARSHTGRGTKRRLRHDQDDEVTNDRNPQKRRLSDEILDAMTQLMINNPRSGYARAAAESQRLPFGTKALLTETLDPEGLRQHLEKHRYSIACRIDSKECLERRTIPASARAAADDLLETRLSLAWCENGVGHCHSTNATRNRLHEEVNNWSKRKEISKAIERLSWRIYHLSFLIADPPLVCKCERVTSVFQLPDPTAITRPLEPAVGNWPGFNHWSDDTGNVGYTEKGNGMVREVTP